jgi:flagellar biosynthesis protein FliQ
MAGSGPPRRPRGATPSRDEARGVLRRAEGVVVHPDELTVRRTVVVAETEPGAVQRGLARSLGALLARDRIVLGALLAIAAVARLPGIAGRGAFDGDQGHDMLTLLRFTREGVVPLLGPPTSIGDFHHGAFYYFLLAPIAAFTGSDPVAVVTAIALMGVAAVGVTWWLARSIGGRLAGLVAGLLIAISPAAIDESTFIWNPNPIPLFAALALAAGWRGYVTGRARWYVLALGCAGAVFQLHVLGIVFLPPVVALLVVDIRRARRRGNSDAVRRLALAGAGGAAVIALLFVPLAIHEVQTGFSETQRAFAYFSAGSDGRTGLDPLSAIVFTLLRVVGWPFVRIVTEAPLGGVFAVTLAVGLGAWLAASAGGDRAVAARWLAGTLAWSVIALSILAPSLQTIVAGLPNDHYHAFLDPVVIVLVAVAGVAMAAPGSMPDAAARTGARPAGVDVAARGLLSMALVAIVALEIGRWPPQTDPNGGWPAAEAAGRRIVETTGTSPVALLGLPEFKTPDLIGFPIVHAGGTLTEDPWAASWLVLPCDRLFESIVGAKCGGPAEDRRLRKATSDGAHPLPTLIARFDVSPRTSVSIYRP